MQPFQFTRIDDAEAAILAHQADSGVNQAGAVHAASEYLAGGTTLLDLMKLDVMRPARIIDINALEKTTLGRIEFDAKGLRLGAMARMSDTADHAEVKRHFPVIAQALQLAASAQIRNMAALAGNVLQRTRCTYFRDTSYAKCNKRIPGSGCVALEGINRSHAVLGTSEQ
jgi:xanthine dehydrogenase YagS FAD-binding subunit